MNDQQIRDANMIIAWRYGLVSVFEWFEYWNRRYEQIQAEKERAA